MAQPYLRQLLLGRDIGVGNPVASQMQNFNYLIGDRETHECMAVDPAWDVASILRVAEEDGMKVVGVICTHHHPDHVGGAFYGFTIEGVAALVERNPCPVHAHSLDAAAIESGTGISGVIRHRGGDTIQIGGVSVALVHTPGHTPGSICLHTDEALIAGDTLFMQGCGRVDLPGGDVDEMYKTLTERLSVIPDEVVLYPGHAYGGERAPMGRVRRTNTYLNVSSLSQWRRMHGA